MRGCVFVIVSSCRRAPFSGPLLGDCSAASTLERTGSTWKGEFAYLSASLASTVTQRKDQLMLVFRVEQARQDAAREFAHSSDADFSSPTGSCILSRRISGRVVFSVWSKSVFKI